MTRFCLRWACVRHVRRDTTPTYPPPCRGRNEAECASSMPQPRAPGRGECDRRVDASSCLKSASLSSTPRCATARRRKAWIFPSTTSSSSRARSMHLGLDYVEGGWPGANPTDTTFFSQDPGLKHARFTAFGMTKRTGRSVANDPGLAALLNSKAKAICLVGKTWDFHVEVALGISQQGERRLHRRIHRGRRRRGPRGAVRCRAFLRRLQGQPALTRSSASKRPSRPARAGSCCATPTAARCPSRSRASSAT